MERKGLITHVEDDLYFSTELLFKWKFLKKHNMLLILKAKQVFLRCFYNDTIKTFS